MADRTLARRVLETEAAAILALVPRLDEHFDHAVALLQNCRGRVILTGMGKSGIICRKIAATLSSTGTAAFFLHPAEAIHGDLGVIQRDDTVMALSYSGETHEILQLLETIRRLGISLIAVTGCPGSTLAQAADVTLDCSVTEEACPMNLAPTASTTAALAIGDALAMTLLVEKGFRQEDFASLHPGGKLGKRFMRVESLMHSGKNCPTVVAGTRMRDVIYEMSSKGLGMTCVCGEQAQLLGLITDGDLRRHMDRSPNILELTAEDVMTRMPVVVSPDTLAAEAMSIMEQRKITAVVVVDCVTHSVLGVVHLHDLWSTSPPDVTIHSKAAGIKLLLLDVDGVLTDGTVIVQSDGSESKPFAIRDGIALVWAQRVGLKVGILSARSSPTTTYRAAQLGITLIYQGVSSKADAYERILDEERLTDNEVAYMGDDIVDLAVLARVGLSTAPADAVGEVRARVHWVSSSGGGRGAVRELVEMILRAQSHWDGVVASYLMEGQRK